MHNWLSQLIRPYNQLNDGYSLSKPTGKSFLFIFFPKAATVLEWSPRSLLEMHKEPQDTIYAHLYEINKFQDHDLMAHIISQAREACIRRSRESRYQEQPAAAA